MRVLVADNDPEALDLVVLDLRLEGHVVLGVSSGCEALTTVAKFAPDVLVLDYRMPPGPTGLDVAEFVRAARPNLSMILYTNYQDAAIARRAADLGMVFLPKGNLRGLRELVSGCRGGFRDGPEGARRPAETW
jgi:CheY-like chemotaxis protein